MKEKFNQIVKNTVLFLLIFLAVQYVVSFFQGDKEIPQNNGNLIVETTKDEYSRTQIVTLEFTNNTPNDITLENDCPNEPFDVYHYENNEWVQKTSAPELACDSTAETVIKSGEKGRVAYSNWNHALFSETGRFRIDVTTTVGDKELSISSNEFTVVKENIFKQLWSAIFYRPIYNTLIYLTNILPGHNLGLAIIILTAIIRTILLLPSQKAMHSQRKMQHIQPKLAKIKEKHKGDQQRIAMETMAIWKEAKVNPMSGCLPILLQFPFLIAVFYVVRDGLNPDHTYLLYTTYQNFTLHDISVNFLGLDLTMANRYVLPVVIGALQFIQMRLTIAKKAKVKKPEKKEGEKSMADEMQAANNMMVYFMPVMIAVFTASLPAGVGIYWGTSTTYAIIQQFFVNKATPPSGNSDDVKVRVIEKN